MAVSQLQFPSVTNLNLPAITGQVIAFIRRRDRFALNEYCQYMPVPQPRFIWHYLERDRAVRVVNLDEMVVHPGDRRDGLGKDKATRFKMVDGLVIPRNESAVVGWMENEQSHSWNLLATEMESAASVMMTARCLNIWNTLSLSSNWGPTDSATNSASANSLNRGAGTWDKASDDPNSNRWLAIQKTIAAAMRNIRLLTNNRVDWSDMVLVLNPDDAIKISQCAEIRHILNNSTAAGKWVDARDRTFIERWFLPPELYGIRCVIEDSMVVTDPVSDGGSEATIDVGRKYIMPSGSAYLMARPGSLDGAPGSVSYSTMQIFHYGGLLQSEAFTDAENRQTRCHVMEYIAPILVAPISGYQITNIMS